MKIKNRFVSEVVVYYLWMVSVKKFCLGALGSSSPIVPGHFYFTARRPSYTLVEILLVQVTCLLDESKPSGQIFVLGTFSFLFLFSTVLNTFFSPFLFF